jgi:hypothetical protein
MDILYLPMGPNSKMVLFENTVQWKCGMETSIYDTKMHLHTYSIYLNVCNLDFHGFIEKS